jgi:hypothetical protein
MCRNVHRVILIKFNFLTNDLLFTRNIIHVGMVTLSVLIGDLVCNLVLDTIIFVMANRRRKKSIVLFGELHYLIKRDIYMFINRQELIFNDHTETRGPQGFRPWRWIIKNARQVFF